MTAAGEGWSSRVLLNRYVVVPIGEFYYRIIAALETQRHNSYYAISHNMATTTIKDGSTPTTMIEEKPYYEFGFRIPMKTKQKIHAVKGPYISLTKFIQRAVDRAIAEQEEEERQQKQQQQQALGVANKKE
jgi:hypothetical protein